MSATNATALGTTLAGTTVASGATLDINNVAIGAEALTINGIGLGGVGALTGTGAGASLSGAIILGTATPTIGGAGTLTLSGILANGAGTTLTKVGAGTLILTAANTYTGTTSAGGGTLIFRGVDGSAISSSAFSVAAGSTLTLDNGAANNSNRLGDTASLTLNGGQFVVLGNAATDTTETLGALNLNSGFSTVTLTPNAAKNTQVTFASLAQSAGATGLFRGTNLGANAVASPTANSSNIVFTAAPSLTGGGGSAGTATVSIVSGAIGDPNAGGTGTGFVTYDSPGPGNGLRPLVLAEYQTPASNAEALTPNANVRLTANRTANDNVSINSLLFWRISL
ncbi:MAG: autotransporter-associated beta strand repeat-containing protein [Rhodocyclaceae bacterium]|nr:autotransporter-associated beta strand repeat-containing protein [Rhodocyclaceae bacterium]